MAARRRLVTRREVLLGAGALPATMAFGWSAGIEPGRLSVHEVAVASPAWPAAVPPLRIAVLTDLHVGMPHMDLPDLARVVERTNALAPDVAVLLGDYVNENHVFDREIAPLFGRLVPPHRTAEVLSRLRPRHGTIAVLGNHDWYLGGKVVTAAFESQGITVLENGLHPIVHGGHRIWFAGLADTTTRTPDAPGTVGAAPPGEAVVVLAHDPRVLPDVPGLAALTLAGHTHGGQVALPWLGPVVMPRGVPRRYAHGLIREDGKTMYVSAGLGTATVPVRFNAMPELPVVRVGPVRPPG